MSPDHAFNAVKAASRTLCISALVFLGACATAVAAPSDSAQVAAVKAAFVFNFAKFTNWPESRLQETDARVVFCLHREDLDLEVAKDLELKNINNRAVAIRILDPQSDIAGCHLFFLSGGYPGTAFGALVARSQRANVLLISDMPGFAERGGHIALVAAGNRFRFKINLGSVMGAGLKLSSKLLQLAEIVTTVER